MTPIEPKLILQLQIEDVRWRTIRGLKPKLAKAVAAVFDVLPKHLQIDSTIHVLCGNDAKIKKLNRDFRGMDKATNVLSFPQFEPQDLKRAVFNRTYANGGDVIWGDIALGYQYVVAEAKRDRKILADHIIHLLIHGILHLFAYTHDDDGAAEKMERLEQKIMRKLGLPDPYAPPDEDKPQRQPMPRRPIAATAQRKTSRATRIHPKQRRKP